MNKAFHPLSRQIIETVLVLLLLLALLLALYDVLRVFFGVLTFAIIFSVSFAKLFERLVRLLSNRRKWAAFVYSVVLIGVIATPLIFIISALTRHLKDVYLWVNEMKDHGLPPLPSWISGIPYIGDKVSSFWANFQADPKATFLQHEVQLKRFLQHMMTSGLGILGATVQVIVGIIISSLFLAKGEKILDPVKSAMQHLLGERSGLSLLEATAMAVKGVSIGVMGTAFIAAIFSWIGLSIAGIQFALGLSAIIFFLVVIQVGPLLVWIPLIIWAISQGHTGLTIFLVIYGILLLIVDAVLKPILIGRSGGKIPFLVLFLGVVGGIAAWGFTGMFKGAIITTVFYTLFTAWLEKDNPPSVKL